MGSAIDRPEPAERPGLATGRQRPRAHESIVRPALEVWTAPRSRGEAAAMRQAAVPCAPVDTTADLVDAPASRRGGYG